ncbi:hypothetical protein [Nonomuraea typhae]|uniref:hypothetical protein n=1 Tax=Nonomuraea typhae TaxID=2603600 RepID=UPI0015E1F1C9|nr:hypothetical protein [Nonomuraea typhae]
MAGVDVYYDAFDDFRTACRKAASGMNVSDAITNDPKKPVKAPGPTTDSSIFGKLAKSGTLATAVDGVWKELGDELGLVKSNLQGVERAIDQVETNLRKADTPQ